VSISLICIFVLQYRSLVCLGCLWSLIAWTYYFYSILFNMIIMQNFYILFCNLFRFYLNVPVSYYTVRKLRTCYVYDKHYYRSYVYDKHYYRRGTLHEQVWLVIKIQSILCNTKSQKENWEFDQRSLVAFFLHIPHSIIYHYCSCIIMDYYMTTWAETLNWYKIYIFNHKSWLLDVVSVISANCMLWQEGCLSQVGSIVVCGNPQGNGYSYSN